MSKLQPWELTPEEMDAALEVGAKTYLAAYEEAYQKHKAGEVVLYPHEFHVKAGAVANAAVKRVVEWMGKVGTDDGIAWCIFNTDWAELKQEVGL